MNKAFITGADNSIADLIPWWISNIRKHDKDTDIVIADFGLSERWHNWVKTKVNKILKYPPHPQYNWFWKPHVILNAPYEYKCWIDLDCEVIDNISDIFDHFEKDKIACADDPYHSWGCRWQTGVFGAINKPEILKQWANASENAEGRGDQEILWNIVKDNQKEHIKEISTDYNWLRLSIEQGKKNPNAKVIHWTGPRGKQIIREKIRK